MSVKLNETLCCFCITKYSLSTSIESLPVVIRSSVIFIIHSDLLSVITSRDPFICRDYFYHLNSSVSVLIIYNGYKMYYDVWLRERSLRLSTGHIRIFV